LREERKMMNRCDYCGKEKKHGEYKEAVVHPYQDVFFVFCCKKCAEKFIKERISPNKETTQPRQV
jgi:ribosomal protein L24E